MKINEDKLQQIIKEELEKVLNEDEPTDAFKVGDKVRPTEDWLRKRKPWGTVVQTDFGWLNQGQVGVVWKGAGIDPETGDPHMHQYQPDQLELYVRSNAK